MTTTTVHADGRTVEVTPLPSRVGLDVSDPKHDEQITVLLTPEQARTVAAALTANPALAVTRDDVDRALINVTSNAMNYPNPSQMLGKDSGPLRKKCVDAMCDLLGIEAENAGDPVEDLATRFKDAARDALRTTVDAMTAIAPALAAFDCDELVNDISPEQWRTMARNVLREEAGSDE